MKNRDLNGLYNVVSSTKLRASRFEITEDELKINGCDACYSFVNIKPGVCVIIRTADGFVLLKEYRYPIKSWTYEFAAGVIDEGECPEDTARREVMEETGFVADEIISLGEFYPSFGATDEVIYLFYAVCSEHHDTSREFTEFITYETVSADEIERLITVGEFKHGAGLAAWLRYKLYTEQKEEK